MKEYLFPVPKRVLLRLLELERERGEPFSSEAVRVSYMLDEDEGKAWSQRRYQKVWRWGHKRVRLHWEDIKNDVRKWRTFYKDTEGTAREQKGHKKGTGNGNYGEEKSVSGHRRGTSETHRGHTSIPEPDLNTRASSAAEIFFEVMGRHPSREQEKLVTSTVTDLDVWHDVLVCWRTNNYSRRNLSGMLDKYHHEYHKRQNTARSDSRNTGLSRGSSVRVGRGIPKRASRKGELSPRQWLEQAGYTETEIERALNSDGSAAKFADGS